MLPVKLNIHGLLIDKISYSSLRNSIINTIEHDKKIIITYANASTINNLWHQKDLTEKLNSFDIIHPDGIGIYLASRFLYGENGFPERMSGSDFYSTIISDSVKNNWTLYFFGHSTETLQKIPVKYPDLKIAGIAPGFNFNSDKVIKEINEYRPAILIVGLSFPIQEKWIIENYEHLNVKVCICVGDGIKVFSGTKIRGPLFMRKFGLEWLVRFISNPFKYFKRYIIGNPLFLGRIILLKMRKFKE